MFVNTINLSPWWYSKFNKQILQNVLYYIESEVYSNKTEKIIAWSMDFFFYSETYAFITRRDLRMSFLLYYSVALYMRCRETVALLEVYRLSTMIRCFVDRWKMVSWKFPVKWQRETRDARYNNLLEELWTKVWIYVRIVNHSWNWKKEKILSNINHVMEELQLNPYTRCLVVMMYAHSLLVILINPSWTSAVSSSTRCRRVCNAFSCARANLN